ncbi:transcriptional regulator [Echinicola pacifica]|uniref:Transcriptional regulator n=1 Tax=Echinicola pacifica TaxID=346377 RepID=A0A918Q2F4_9BACT|nr:ROK family transcriptional regulator [Echinicola pacifica]GGZ30653.1 transcriptional regulator [Echinicola pacifica]
MNLIDPKKNLEEKEGVVEIKNYLNKIKIIKNLYTNGSNTASEICNEVGISLPTVNSLLTDLIQGGQLIKQGRAESQGGRKPDLYRLGSDSFYVLSLDISKFSIRAAIYDSSNKAVTETGTFKITLNNEKSTFDKISDFMETYMQESGVANDKIIAIGMSMPGLVDSVNGINHTYLKFGKKTLVENFEGRFDKKVFIENDARAMTLAEFKFSQDQKYNNVLGIFVGWGIGLGIIIDGKLYRGGAGFAGEFSHSPIFESREISCTCGKKGCLEAVASGTAMVRMAEDAITKDTDSILSRMARERGENIDPSLIVDAALAGDQRAITILSDVGLDLGRGISILIQLLNPDLIIVGGSVAEAQQYLITPIQQALNIFSMAKSREKSELVLYKLGKEVGLLGGVAVVIENIFEDIIN